MKIKQQSEIYAKIISRGDPVKQKHIFKEFFLQRVEEEMLYRDVVIRLLKAKKEKAVLDDELFSILKRSLDAFKHSKEIEFDMLMEYCHQCSGGECNTCCSKNSWKKNPA